MPGSKLDEGRFGRMFRRLRPFVPDKELIESIATAMADTPPAEPARDNPRIPAGYTYLGQFIDHDITFDPTSITDRRNDPDALTNFRTPRFDLDNVYGSGPADQPYLYNSANPGHLLVGRHDDEFDLPRNGQGTAIIGDPRNDENIIVSQLHLTMMFFHNKVMERLAELPVTKAPGEDDFTVAQRVVRWHYQWMVVHDFLKLIVGEATLADVLPRRPLVAGGEPVERPNLCFYNWRNQPFMPVEFAAAAYRFGHSMIRSGYKFNTTVPPLPIFTSESISDPNTDPLSHLGGFRTLPPLWQIEWARLFALHGKKDNGVQVAASRRIDTKIAPPLLALPPEVAPDVASLAARNLTRGAMLRLPSGQDVSRAMGVRPLSAAELGMPEPGPAPLWYYVLREAEVRNKGEHLGPVGGRIVAEVFVGLLAADPSSYLRNDPSWIPFLPSSVPGDFTMSDLITFSGFGLDPV
ncbi:peroxidase family protein [Murinocardiopsis flavida]|uniref:peroxidase family protein n=1 Tax=Murinocardiopsis flavida TaxID=645275 RepID=UPI001FE8AB94|nr:heme peroxidase family protein [Murinocardiopsis flavida]